VLAAGLLVLAGVLAAVIVALTAGGDGRVEPLGNGVAAIDAEGGIDSFAEAATPPSNIAVGEGAVWALNTEDDTVSRIDPKTTKVVKTFETGGHPSDLAAGAGALWVGDGGARPPFATERISRIDPESAQVTRTVKLPDMSGGVLGAPSMGYPRIAVGSGAVWASNLDETVSRIDPETGRIVATIDVGVSSRRLAAGKEGAWLLDWEGRSIVGIDPRTNRVTARLRVGSNFLSAIAVGAGSIWVTSEEGLLWRIEPGPRPLKRTIDVGVGSTYVAFGDGAVWTANYVDGTVSRIDPRTNTVTARVPVGASQALAAGVGSAWVSVAAGTRDGVLPASTCSEVASGGRQPDVLIASDLPSRAPTAPARAGWPTRSASCSRTTASRLVITWSATSPATTQPRRAVPPRSASALRTRTHTRARSGWWP
jgi:YVTN family beta-propeller protein